MYLIRGIGNIETFNRKFPNQSMSGTIGNFDGLHLGHQAILNQVKDKARESSSASLVFFTEPNLPLERKSKVAKEFWNRLCIFSSI